MDLIPPDEPLPSTICLGSAVEFKMVPDAAEAGTIEGYASTFDGIDLHGDSIRRGAFADTIAMHRKASTAPAMLWQHRHNEPIGRWTAMGEDARGLRVRGVLNRETEAGRQAHAHVKGGSANGLSIGWHPLEGGIKAASHGRVLSKIYLHEVSIVALPADTRARITEVKSLASRAELEDMLREGGLPKGAARKIAAAGWPALNGEPEPTSPTTNPALDLVLKALDRNLVELKGLVR